MDLREYVKGFHNTTCIFSVYVEKGSKPDGSHGDICIAAANEKFIYMLENRADVLPSTGRRERFTEGLPYDEFLEKDLTFEHMIYDAAVLKKPIHTYVHITTPDMWFNVFALPVECDDGGLCYCTYSIEPTQLADIDMVSSSSVKTSSDVLKTCIKLHGTDDFQKTMQEVMKEIRIICDSAVCTIMLVDTEEETCEVLATNIREQSTLKRVTQFTNFYEIASSWAGTIGDRDCLIIKSKSDMKYISEINHPWWLTLDEAGVESVVIFPLRHNGELLGYIWVTNFDVDDTMRIKETLELTTYFVSSEIANYKMMKRLEHISFTDLLTGVNNRNAMNNRVRDITEGNAELKVPFGVVFADLNGLKTVNDLQGHTAGDLLLKKAAILLQEVFDGDEIYRAGGDEFMVMIWGCTEEEFGQKVNALKERSADPDNVCFAVGTHFCHGQDDIRHAMRLADEDMYRDKAEYYRRYPERKQR